MSGLYQAFHARLPSFSPSGTQTLCQIPFHNSLLDYDESRFRGYCLTENDFSTVLRYPVIARFRNRSSLEQLDRFADAFHAGEDHVLVLNG
jgi:hypothetical protein